VLIGVQGVEIRDALQVEHADLAIDDEPLLFHRQGDLGNPWEAPRPVEPALGQDLDVAAVTDYAPAVAVVFDFVNPVGAARHGLGRHWFAILKFMHAAQIGSA
jgi:hypothetical protein